MSYYPDSMRAKAYWIEEWNRFREIMCSTKYTVEQVERAFRALSLLYLDFPDDEDFAFVQTSFLATANEYERRALYRIFYPRTEAIAVGSGS